MRFPWVLRSAWATPLALALACASCAQSPSQPLLRRYETQNSISSFRVCRDYGCSVTMPVSLSDAEWGEVRNVFMPAPANAAEERERIREAVALIERMVGPKAGTANDEAGAVIVTTNKRGQLDCIDEAYNTSNYLRFMHEDNLIDWHDIGEPARRGYIINRWPHNTATVIEHGSGASYAIDSWFGPNGALPDVVPLEDWRDGWSPPEPTA